MTSLSIRDFLIVKKKVIEIIPTAAIKCGTTDAGTLLAHKIFRYMKWRRKRSLEKKNSTFFFIQ